MNLEKTKIISFDIFETLIIRNLGKPTHVFDIVQIAYNNLVGNEYLDFAKERIEAEQKCRKMLGKEEITFNDIYAYISVAEDKKKILMSLEIQVELAVCRTNPIMKKIYQKYLDNGYAIILISDMYLEESIIKLILDNCGYYGYSKLFLSSKVGLMKYTGNLYRYALRDLKIDSKSLLHYGNNFKMDFYIPRKIGIKAIWYKNRIPTKEYRSRMNDYVSRLFYYDKLDGTLKHDLGYRVIGPVAVGFCIWIHNYCQRLRKNKIFFLSRDGYLLSKVYEKYFEKEDIAYIRVSRRALRNAHLGEIKTFEQFYRTIPPFKEYSIKLILDIMGCSVESEIYKECEKIANCSLDELFARNEILYNSDFIHVFEYVKQIKYKEWNEQKLLLLQYLDQENFQGNIAVVDLSFKGTAFGLLENICSINHIKVNMDGFVLGRTEQAFERIGESAERIHGWIFETMFNNPIAHVLLSNATLYERFFFDDTGTTLKYTEKGSHVQAVLETDNKEKDNFEVIEEVKNGVMEFAISILPFYELVQDELTWEMAIKHLIRFLLYPQSSYVKRLGNLVENNIIIRYIAKPDTYGHYLMHLQDLPHDLKNSFWKQGFIKRLVPGTLVIHIYNYIYFRNKKITVAKIREIRNMINK